MSDRAGGKQVRGEWEAALGQQATSSRGRREACMPRHSEISACVHACMQNGVAGALDRSLLGAIVQA